VCRPSGLRAIFLGPFPVGLRPRLHYVAASRLEAATVATRRGFHVAFAFRGLKPTATGNRRDATADEGAGYAVATFRLEVAPVAA
jgi:hypothetical protein